ncbi:MAG: hypothetical protein QQN41_06480 [Nitrosopumilus sp.]
MKDHKPNTEVLAKVNEAIQRIAVKTGSKVIKNQMAVEFLDDCVDYIFGGVIDEFCTYRVSGVEIYKNDTDEKLDELVKVRIALAMREIINLLEDELDLLRK